MSSFQRPTALPVRQADANPPTNPATVTTLSGSSTPLLTAPNAPTTATSRSSRSSSNTPKPQLQSSSSSSTTKHNPIPKPQPSKSLNRPVGLAALTAQSKTTARFASHGTNLRRANAESLSAQFAKFQQQLHEFSIKHGAEIRQNKQFRGEFARMCAALGVDPLAAAVEGAKAKARAGERVSVGDGVVEEVGAREGGKEKGIGGLKGLLWDRMGKGFGKSGSVRTQAENDSRNSLTNLYDPDYNHDRDHETPPNDSDPSQSQEQGLSAETKQHLAEMLGGSINQFYWELALRIVQIVIETRTENGGLMELAELKRRVRKPRPGLGGIGSKSGSDVGGVGGGGVGGGLDVSEQDIIHAILTLAPLGPGYTIITIRRTRFLRSVPRDLNPDQTTVLSAMQVLGYATVSMLRANLDWSAARAYAVLQDLVVESVAWVDGEQGLFYEGKGGRADADADAEAEAEGWGGESANGNGGWEERYWSAAWMYRNRRERQGGREGDGDGDVIEDAVEHVIEEVVEDKDRDVDTDDNAVEHARGAVSGNEPERKKTSGSGASGAQSTINTTAESRSIRRGNNDEKDTNTSRENTHNDENNNNNNNNNNVREKASQNADVNANVNANVVVNTPAMNTRYNNAKAPAETKAKAKAEAPAQAQAKTETHEETQEEIEEEEIEEEETEEAKEIDREQERIRAELMAFLEAKIAAGYA